MADTTQVFAQRCPHCGLPATPGIAFCSQCGASLELRAGDDALQSRLRALFGRDLEIEREIGRGGMAAVFVAFDPELQRRVAVKALLPEVAENADVAERFRREARTVAALQHPNIVSVYGVRTDAEISAIVMQYVDGRSLDVALAGQPRLPLQVAGMILAQVAEALQHAHERGVVHRDVKPANVLLDHDGHAVVSDFGIARRQGGTRITDTGVVMGTIAYMSPEQCLGGEVTPASDQYSFGVMAYELLAGRRPFPDAPVIDMLRAHVDQAPEHLSSLRPEIPAATAAYVMRALAKAPEDRHPDLRQARQVFGSLVGNAKSTTEIIASMAAPTAPVVVAPAATVRMADETVKLPAPSTAAPRSRRTPILAATAVVVALAIGAVFLRPARTAPEREPAIATQSGTPVVQPPATTEAKQPVANPGITATRTPARPSTADATARTDSVPPAKSAPASRDSSSSAPPKPVPSAAPAAVAPAASPAAPPASSPASSAAAAPTVTAALADARAVAREFVTICNQRRTRDLEQLGTLDGDAALRADLLKRVASAPEFAAGYERVASAPVMSGDRFTTEFVIDAEWRGGQLLAAIRLQAAQQGGAWHLVAFGVSAAP